MLSTSIQLLVLCTLTHPAAETKSVGLQADAQFIMYPKFRTVI